MQPAVSGFRLGGPDAEAAARSALPLGTAGAKLEPGLRFPLLREALG